MAHVALYLRVSTDNQDNGLEAQELALINYCKENNISPGGSADLLSVSLLIHFVKNAQL